MSTGSLAMGPMQRTHGPDVCREGRFSHVWGDEQRRRLLLGVDGLGPAWRRPSWGGDRPVGPSTRLGWAELPGGDRRRFSLLRVGDRPHCLLLGLEWLWSDRRRQRIRSAGAVPRLRCA